MLELLWLIPALPFAGFLLLSLAGSRVPRSVQTGIGLGSVAVSALLTLLTGIAFIQSHHLDSTYSQELWTWLAVGNLEPSIAFSLDALSLTFMFVITFVGFLIHLYSVEFMKEEEGYARFFAYMNLFIGSMLLLVMADNLLLLYLGWEGVGLCSYLLIGFWYKEPENGYAARKAFIITRIGDVALAIGLFLIFYHANTLHIQDLLTHAGGNWEAGSMMTTSIALLLLGGALGKSAQLPLQTWLPDAMAGPSPVSALIHAATMVTAGVYLIARMHTIFELSPATMSLIAIIGAATLLYAGFSALAQRDIKRVLAYSTISQIGYMFLALGLGAWSAAVFHFVTHAFFKALLFLGAGAIIINLHHEHDMFKMGGLKKQLPTTFWTFLIASASLAALPLITAGFYSKDLILWYSWSAANGNFWLWLAALAGALITAIYTFRMVFLTFYGKAKSEITGRPGLYIKIPLVILAGLSLIAGFVEMPHNWVHFTPFSGFLENVLPKTDILTGSYPPAWVLQLIAAVVSLGGIYLAYLFFYPGRETVTRFQASRIAYFLKKGWGFDWLYKRLFINPIVWISSINRNDFIDYFYTIIGSVSKSLHLILIRSQNGKIRWYAIGILIGTLLTTTIILLL